MICTPSACGRCMLANGCHPVPLARMSPGDRGTVLALELARPADARKLMALGVVPGASIELTSTVMIERRSRDQSRSSLRMTTRICESGVDFFMMGAPPPSRCARRRTGPLRAR